MTNVSNAKNKKLRSAKSKQSQAKVGVSSGQSHVKGGGRFSVSKAVKGFGDGAGRSLSRKRRDTVESGRLKAGQVQLRRDLEKRTKELRKLTTLHEALKGSHSTLKKENERLQVRVEGLSVACGKVGYFC